MGKIASDVRRSKMGTELLLVVELISDNYTAALTVGYPETGNLR